MARDREAVNKKSAAKKKGAERSRELKTGGGYRSFMWTSSGEGVVHDRRDGSTGTAVGH